MLDVWRCDSCWNLDDPGASAGSSGGDGRSVRFAASTAGSVHAAAPANADAAGQLARNANLERARDTAPGTAHSDPIGSASRGNSSSVASDGKGFVSLIRPPESGVVRELNLVTNWFEELERVAPSGIRK